MKKRFSPDLCLLLLILILGLFLRFYKFSDGFNFSPELGDNLLEIKNSFFGGVISLVGPPTSHPWLRFGPLYYWILTPLLALFNWNPLVAGYFGVTVGSALILINYIFTGKIFSKKIALISSGLMAVSPLWLSYSRDARFYFLVTIFFYPFYLLLKKYSEGNKKAIYGSVFFWGIMLNFHLSPLIFLPVIVILLVLKKEGWVMNLKLSGTLLITQLPFLIYDAKNGFDMTKKLILWLPYRLAGFFYLYPKNNPTFEGFAQSLRAILELTGKTFFFDERFWPLMALVFFLLFVKNSRKRDCLLLTAFLFLSFSAVLIHGDSPTHYLLPVFPALLLLVSVYLSKLNWRVLMVVFFLVVLVNKKHDSNAGGYMDYKTTEGVAGAIIKDAGNRKYSLKRIGSYDYFEGDFAQNYQYLLWWKGNEPLPGEPLVYTVCEIPVSVGRDESVIYIRDKVIVTKKEASE